ncbi:hypothetical protein RUMCAL_03491, partial [Ruminococcus callidus ATCC 27760]
PFKGRFKLMTLQRDHPRLCGEKTEVGASTMETMGSPPPMRGKATGTAAGIRLDGITPAYAGKRLGSQYVCSAVRDHPRLCGEKI